MNNRSRIKAHEMTAQLDKVGITSRELAELLHLRASKTADWRDGREEILPMAGLVISLLDLPGALDRLRVVAKFLDARGADEARAAERAEA